MEQFKGIFPALITPFDKNNRIDDKALTKLVEHLMSQGSKGFYINGSTGECHLMTIEERKHTITLIREITKGKAVLINHIGTMGTDISCELARHSCEIGVDAISSTPPFYYKHGFEQIKEYYKALTKAAELPMIVYYFPELVGVDFNINQILELCAIDNVSGVKFTSYNSYLMQRIRFNAPEKLVYNGRDEVYLSALVAGCSGAIGSTFNYMLPAYIRLYELYKKQDILAAQELQAKINETINVLDIVSSLPAHKYLVSKQGVECGSSRSPIKPLSEDDKQILDKIHAKVTALL